MTGAPTPLGRRYWLIVIAHSQQHPLVRFEPAKSTEGSRALRTGLTASRGELV